MLRNRLILFSTALLSAASYMSAQEPVQRASRLTTSYLLGGSGDGYFFEMDHGFGFSVGHGAKWNGFSLIGGAGFEKFRRSSFYPLFVAANTSLGRNERCSLGLRAGYSFANSSGPSDVQEYRLRGGPLAELGIELAMFRTPAGYFSVGLGYRYQRARLEFKPFDARQKISSVHHYHFVSLKIGYTLFHQQNLAD